MGNIGGVGSTDEATDAERRPHLVSPGLPRHASSEGRSTSTVQRCDDPKAMESKPPLRSPSFPVSHLLDFGAEARAERHELSIRLSSELRVPASMALAALETFALDVTKARRWLQSSQRAQQVCFDVVSALLLLNVPTKHFPAITVIQGLRCMHHAAKSHFHCYLAC